MLLSCGPRLGDDASPFAISKASTLCAVVDYGQHPTLKCRADSRCASLARGNTASPRCLRFWAYRRGRSPIPSDYSSAQTDIPVTYVPARNPLPLLRRCRVRGAGSQYIFIGANAVDTRIPRLPARIHASFERAGERGPPKPASKRAVPLHSPAAYMSKAEIPKRDRTLRRFFADAFCFTIRHPSLGGGPVRLPDPIGGFRQPK